MPLPPDAMIGQETACNYAIGYYVIHVSLHHVILKLVPAKSRWKQHLELQTLFETDILAELVFPFSVREGMWVHNLHS